ncbi:argininosuccinate lyase [Variovorax sp.]|uniref:argininosuccinate lyase n=1 Tax=Variovorax sp. TaxID=1871043 RepID=UPI00137EDABC|nr:argininosuccinate lyase [Variovorax sp.]KAF1066507.1 MAG: Argininosuccinate lyase [Variovorax sp.]
MKSLVSGLLHEPLAGAAQQAIFRPWITDAFAAVLPHLTQVNQAHLVMLVDRGLMDAPSAATLLRAIARLQGEGPSAFAIDASLEDVYFNYEAELIRRVGQGIGGRVHMARSRNDLQSTLDRMRARRNAVPLLEEVCSLRAALLAKAERFSDCVMPGYTHLQHAQPITFGFYLLGIEQSLQRDTRRLFEAHETINRCPLGAGALAGTTFAIDREQTARLLGFDGAVPHALDAIASKDAIQQLLVAGMFLSISFGRMAQDFYQMSTYESGMLELPDSLAITSSIMPQKKNQAVLEFVKGRQSHVLGAIVTAFGAFRGTPFSHVLDGNADSLQWAWPTLDGLASLLPVVRLVVEGAEPQPERMRHLAAANFSTATDLADFLVGTLGLAFKDAHHVTGRIVRLALERGLLPGQVDAGLVAEASMQALGREIAIPDATLATVLDPARAVERRVGCGGPSASDTAALARAAGECLSRDRQRVSELEQTARHATRELDERVQGLIASAAN